VPAASLHSHPDPASASAFAHATPATEQHEALAQSTFIAHCALVLIVLVNTVPALLLGVIPGGSASIIRRAIRVACALVSLVACLALAGVFWHHLYASGSLPAHWLRAEVAAASWARVGAALDAFVAGVAPWPVWAGALGATVAVSVVPLPLLLVLRVRAGGRAIRALLAFAVGSLLGDVFLHLLPHAISPHVHHQHADESHSHSHSHSHADHQHGHGGHEEAHDHGAALRVGLLVLAGMLVFFVLEKLLRVCLRDGHSHSHSHSHSHAPSTAAVAAPSAEIDASTATADAEASSERAARQFGTRVLHSLADASHNFTDGMFLAASFLAAHRAHVASLATAGSASADSATATAAAAASAASFFTWRALAAPLTDALAVLVHEIPHEIGDYALHVQSGATRCSGTCECVCS
jgi:zinc transporter ZupT